MLYTKIRYAKQIRKLYKMRHLLEYDRHPELGSRLGYKKYSRYYYLLTKKLKQEKVLSKEGRFIENITNNWLAELPIIANPTELHTLGFKPAFSLYLSLVFVKQLTASQIRHELKINTKSIYDSIKKLTGDSLIITNKPTMQIDEKNKFFSWLIKYFDLAVIQADNEDDISLLFDCVPGYIDGPQAYYMTNYESGRTIGPSNMIIRTRYIFVKYWEHIVNHVSYFKKYPKKIMVLPSSDDAEIIWLDGLPYNKKSRDEF